MEKSYKKWSLGNILFRKSKKDIPQADFSSDEDDRKAGFGNDFVKKAPKKVKSNKNLVESFDQQQYSVANPEFHYFKPSPQQPNIIQQRRSPQIYVNKNSFEYLNNQRNIEKNQIAQPNFTYGTYQGSSQDEKSSYKNGSETGSRTSLNKRSRNARNERYYQRIMREDGRPLTVYGSVNSIENHKYQPPLNGTQNRLSASIKSSSLCSSDFTLPKSPSHSLPIPRYRGNPDDKDDYENIHNVDDSIPPPVPPRDPNRRFSVTSSSISQQPYYFDHGLQKYVIFNTNGKCFSDDKLWKNDEYRQAKSVSNDPNHQPHILRPRSRKPLSLNTNLDNECVFSSEDVVDNPCYPVSQSKRSKSAVDFEKLMNEPVRNKTALRQRNLTSVEPIKYHPIQNQQQEYVCNELQALRKKYSSVEDVNKNKVRPPTAIANTPDSRKSFTAMDLNVRNGNVSSNLDDAINELEMTYKSLVKDDLVERVERRNLPTPTKFSIMMRKYEEYENEENKNDKEPDVVLDDVFSRNLKHANQMLKPSEPLPFGIPNQKLCPIPPKPSHDYLSVEPIQMRRFLVVAPNNPDLIADDFAVRTLRKDNPSRRRNMVEIDNNHFMKRNHTLSSLSDHIYNGILKDSAKPSGGTLEEYLQLDPIKPNNDIKSTPGSISKSKIAESEKHRADDFEKSLNALVIESKAISQKLEKDLSKLKRESVTPNTPKTMTNLLDFRKSIETEKEKKSTSCSPIKSLQNILNSEEKTSKHKVIMTSTACSPIKDFEVCSPVENTAKIQAPKQQKAEKIENLIKMFDTNNSSEPTKLFQKSTEVETKPPTQPTNGALKKVNSIEEKSFTPLRIISPKIVSPTKLNPRVTSSASPQVKVDVESNIKNIKDLIQQIKQTEFDKNQKEKAIQDDLPDYDNIKDDYEMTEGGRLERKSNVTTSKSIILVPMKLFTPESVTNTSSSLRETSAESFSKESPKSDHFKESAAMYNDAIEFLHKTAEVKATNAVDNEHKSPIKSIRQDKDVVLNYIDTINGNLVDVVKDDAQEEKSKTNVKESVSKLEVKILLSRQSSETSENSVSTPKQPSPPVPPIKPVVLPQIGQSDTESLYNSAEELSMIFGTTTTSDTVQPGKINEEDIEAEFEKLVHDNNIADENLLDESIDVTLTDLNNNTDNPFAECSDNKSNDMINQSQMPTIASDDFDAAASNVCFPANSDDNNNSLTATDLSKLKECQTNKLIDKKHQPSTSNSRLSPLKSNGRAKTDNNCTSIQPSPLRAQCILLCLYCLILYLQFIIFKLRSS